MMNIIKEHIEHLQNNPEGYWFKRKLYGWGWTPATKEGWLTILAYTGFVLWFVYNLDQKSEHVDWVIELALPFGVATLVLLVTCYQTGEPLRWSWGRKENENP